MNRSNSKKDEHTKSLSEEVTELIDDNGGWLNVLGLMTRTFDQALSRVGRSVDCPFPERHGNGGGKGDFRFSNKPSYEGRAICTCMQDKGMGPWELLTLAGVGNNFVSCALKVKNALKLGGCSATNRPVKVAKPLMVQHELSGEEQSVRRGKLEAICSQLVTLGHPSAAPAREYFRKRGIPLNARIRDVRFHPGLPCWQVCEKTKKPFFAGTFPAIVSAFRDSQGRVVNLHRIFITHAGMKAPVRKVKMICSPLNNFSGSSIEIASSVDRVLHITEGVEKGWAIHLATEGSVKVAYSCSTLHSLHVDKTKYDDVAIWSDCDPDQPHRERTTGDGQYFAWKLAKRLYNEGFRVTFMMPSGNSVEVKGRDWEDVIVQEKVLALPGAERFQNLQTFAVNGGVKKRQTNAA